MWPSRTYKTYSALRVTYAERNEHIKDNSCVEIRFEQSAPLT